MAFCQQKSVTFHLAQIKYFPNRLDHNMSDLGILLAPGKPLKIDY